MKYAPQEIRTFFVTSVANARNPIFRDDKMARLFMSILADNRKKAHFLLHEFVAMPDHFHLILTPAPDVSLEKAVQFIKGGFSFRAKKDLGVSCLIWQEGFKNHRIRDEDDYVKHREYIRNNPVKAGLVNAPEEYPYSSAANPFGIDPMPPALKRKS